MLMQYYPHPQHDYSYELNKDMNFSAAHFIPDEQAGKCANMHGHTYVVNITIAGDQLDDTGFLVNFQKLKELVHKRYDHRILNELEEFSGVNFPTTEVIAQVIWQRIENYLKTVPNQPSCLQILVRETPTSYVLYRPKKDENHG